jgi:hypothetical protein
VTISPEVIFVKYVWLSSSGTDRSITVAASFAVAFMGRCNSKFVWINRPVLRSIGRKLVRLRAFGFRRFVLSYKGKGPEMLQGNWLRGR